MNHNSVGKIVWIATIGVSIGYYIIKTMVLSYGSNTLDAFVLMYGTVSLVVYLYFFRSKKPSP